MNMSTVTIDTVKTIKTLNAIAECGLNVFDKDHYKINNDSENPDAIVLRSFNMHSMEFENQLKAIARHEQVQVLIIYLLTNVLNKELSFSIHQELMRTL